MPRTSAGEVLFCHDEILCEVPEDDTLKRVAAAAT